MIQLNVATYRPGQSFDIHAFDGGYDAEKRVIYSERPAETRPGEDGEEIEVPAEHIPAREQALFETAREAIETAVLALYKDRSGAHTQTITYTAYPSLSGDSHPQVQALVTVTGGGKIPLERTYFFEVFADGSLADDLDRRDDEMHGIQIPGLGKAFLDWEAVIEDELQRGVT